MNKFDIAVIGGGMVGAAVALGLAQQGRQVVLIEGHPPMAYTDDQAMDIRVSAISHHSVDILQTLGAWSAIEKMRLCPYRRLETWEHPECRTRFNSEELGLEQLGYIVENRVIQLGLWQQFEQYPNLTVICPDSLASLTIDDDVQITLSSGSTLSAQWVVGADGANSKVRDMASIGVTAWDYRQHCMLINVTTECEQQDITWQQFTPSGPRSFLPLCGQQASLVWYDSPKRIKQLGAMSPKQLGEEVMASFPAELGHIKVLQHGSFPLTRRHAQQYVNNRCILVGDSAHTINPLAGQGVNLGFKDVAALLDAVEGQSISSTLLSVYERKRRGDNSLMQSGMDFFYAGFSNDIAPLKFLRNAALKLADKAGPIKQQVLKYALGLK